MDSTIPFINATTVGAITGESVFAEAWDSIIRTTVTALLMTLVAELILFAHLQRSNAAAAQIVATGGNTGGSLSAVHELITNRRKGARHHEYKRRHALVFLYLFGIGLYHGANYVVAALIQQRGTRTLQVSTLSLQLWRVSDQEVVSGIGCVNKQLTYRNGQSDLQVGLCHMIPHPTSFEQECVGIVKGDLSNMYGIYHPRIANFNDSTTAGTALLGPMVVTGNTALFRDGTIPVLEVQITKELVRNMFSDMVSGNVVVEELEYREVDTGSNDKGLGLCGDRVIVNRGGVMGKLIGGLGFIPGNSRIIDTSGRETVVPVETSASRTSILAVVYIGVGTIVVHLIVFFVMLFWERRTGIDAGVKEIVSSAISQVCNSDSVIPAVVSNGDVNLTRVNTEVDGQLYLGVYRTDEAPEEVAEKGS